MKVLFIASEAFPFVKTGGLADVIGSLPQALQEKDAEIRVIIPKYAAIAKELTSQMTTEAEFTLGLAWRRLPCRVERLDFQGITYYFLDSAYHFDRPNLYGYEDDGERFACFSKAVLAALPSLGYQPDILHCHDWHTALVPLLLQENYRTDPYYSGMKTVLTIHNLHYQGRVSTGSFEDLLGLAGHPSAWEKLLDQGSLNYLKAGILAADLVTTVSPSYALEIQDAYYGEGLHDILNRRKAELSGILNGIDTTLFDPLKDPHLAVNYRSDWAKKQQNKKALQALLKLPAAESQPMLAIVSRLVEQKGLDLVVHVLEEILSMEIQMVVLGTGEGRYIESFRHYAEKYPEKLALCTVYDEVLAHKIYAGADLLLMPSKTEPCGLSQMIAMRYGTLPVVREVGGLKDSVIPYNEFTKEGTGFSFVSYNAHELLFTIQKAVKIFYEDKRVWKGLVKNALSGDFSWRKSAGKYLELYQRLLGKGE